MVMAHIRDHPVKLQRLQTLCIHPLRKKWDTPPPHTEVKDTPRKGRGLQTNSLPLCCGAKWRSPETDGSCPASDPANASNTCSYHGNQSIILTRLETQDALKNKTNTLNEAHSWPMSHAYNRPRLLRVPRTSGNFVSDTFYEKNFLV